MSYKVFKHKISVCDTETDSYGISVSNNNIIVEKYYDVSLNREKLESFVLDLNRYEVEPVHLKGMIDDFLVDNF